MWVTFVISAALFSAGMCRPQHEQSQDESAGNLYHPDGRSRRDWASCGGLPCEQWEASQRAATLLGVAEAEGQVDALLESSPVDVEEEVGVDVLLSPEQALHLLHAEEEEGEGEAGHVIHKRKISSLPVQRWQMPIKYKFDGDLSNNERALVRLAIRHWESHTCVRMNEVSLASQVNESHLLFTQGLPFGCASYVGRLNLAKGTAQTVNLPVACLRQFGTPVHEIGHALGLWHEHQRPSRDQFIDIVKSNVREWARFNFVKGDERRIDEHRLPYDFNSVMHYAGVTASKTGRPTIQSKDARFQSNMGQRVALSFLDAMVVNRVYCHDKCAGARRVVCKRGGYVNPNDCRRCICPPGLGGKTCDRAQPSITGACSGTRVLRPGEDLQLASPGYDRGLSYTDGTACNWLIKSPPGTTLKARFDDDFGVYARNGACYHWVEVQHSGQYIMPGPRSCGRRAVGELESDSNEMLVTFRSAHRAPRAAKRRFSLTVTCVSNDVVVPDSPPANTTITPNTSTQQVVTWSKWSRCDQQCQCGGCASRTRHALCDGRRCEGSADQVQTTSCPRVCTTRDTEIVFLGTFQRRACKACCRGYVRRGRMCVPK